MVTLENLQSIIKKNQNAIRRLGVKSLSVFGSVVRDELTSGSDLDFLVEFERPVGMFQFLEVKYLLEEIFKMPVDLATMRALHPMLKDQILKEAIRVA